MRHSVSRAAREPDDTHPGPAVKRIPELDGLRCIAVMMVVMKHASLGVPGGYTHWLAPLRLVSNSDFGVLIFFVLSGFLITSLLRQEFHANGRIDLWGFYVRRTLRIAPAFYVYLLFLLGCTVTGVLPVDWRQIGLAATYLWNYAHLLHLDAANLADPEGIWYVGHVWSLALEEQFYWLWPAVLMLILGRRRPGILTCMILVVPALRMLTYVEEPWLRPQLRMMFHTGSDAIFVGCFFALHRERLAQRLRRWLDDPRALWLLVLAVFVVVPDLLPGLGGAWKVSYGRTVNAVLIGLLLLAVVSRPSFTAFRVLRHPVLVYVGRISYSLYLWQQVVTLPASPFSVRFPVNVAEALIIAALSYQLIERPCVAWAHARRPMRGAVGARSPEAAVQDN